MTSPTTIGPEQQHLEGRSVRDIVEYSPEQVNEVWCRRIFRQILQSLELQYAMHMPHRAITPDTIVFHDNGEPLLTPLDIGPPDDREAEDLTALARVVHYAITQELVPAGPLHGRIDGYSEALLAAVDRCMDPDPAHRPQTIAALRDLLGMVPPGAPVRAATPHMMPGLPADDDLAPPAADALAPAHPDGILPGAAHDAAHETAHAFPAGAADAAGSATAGTRDAPAAAAHDGIHAVPVIAPAPHDLPPPGHDAAPGSTHGANLDDARNGAQAGVQLGKSDADDAGARAAAHDTSTSTSTSTSANMDTPRDDKPDTAPIATPSFHAAPPPAAPAGPVAASTAAAPHAVPAAPATARPAAAPAPRRATGLSRRQRWALGAGGAALVALVLATVAEMRDSGPIEHIDLATPQSAGGATPAPGAQPLPAGTPAPAAGTAAAVPAPVPAGEGAAAGLGPGETIIPGSAAPGQPAAAQPQPLPGVVVTPNGNVYRLQIQPWGVVHVDGVDRGVSPPVKRLTLTPGRHTIRITNPNYHERVLDIDTATGNGQIVVDFTEEAR